MKNKKVVCDVFCYLRIASNMVKLPDSASKFAVKKCSGLSLPVFSHSGTFLGRQATVFNFAFFTHLEMIHLLCLNLREQGVV